MATPFDPELPEILLRLAAATAIGMGLGLDRDVRRKPSGMRTLGLVGLGAALVSLATVNLPQFEGHPDALSRVVQGVLQGVLAGVGFIGAGVILRDRDAKEVQGLTTAATVWVTAALGIACALAPWTLIGVGAGAAAIILVIVNPIERRLVRLLRPRRKRARPDDSRELTSPDESG